MEQEGKEEDLHQIKEIRFHYYIKVKSIERNLQITMNDNFYNINFYNAI